MKRTLIKKVYIDIGDLPTDDLAWWGLDVDSALTEYWCWLEDTFKLYET
jgi:hypothetical protein